MGVKQGCLLSPLVFSLFLNDLFEFIGGGIRISQTPIRILAYADDLIFIADNRLIMQEMIDRLKQYCDTWNLKLNLNKSKMMVFRNGGRLKKIEKFYFGGCKIDIVNEYKYLGIIVTPKFSLSKHLTEKASTSKVCLNLTWKNIINNKYITCSKKMLIFNAVIRATLCYGAQVWGYQKYDTVEAIQRTFLKRLFRLPQYTPNYLLQIETGLESLYIFTIKMHFEYMLRCLELPTYRLPYLMARYGIEHNFAWFKEWKALASKYNVEIDWKGANPRQWKTHLYDIMCKIKTEELEGCYTMARNSNRLPYKYLNYDETSRSYIKDELDIGLISNILRCRGDLLELNSKPWRNQLDKVCPMCSMGQIEDIFHFLGSCPALSPYRLKQFGTEILETQSIYCLLNGKDYSSLNEFILQALGKRNQIVKGQAL